MNAVFKKLGLLLALHCAVGDAAHLCLTKIRGFGEPGERVSLTNRRGIEEVEAVLPQVLGDESIVLHVLGGGLPSRSYQKTCTKSECKNVLEAMQAGKDVIRAFRVVATRPRTFDESRSPIFRPGQGDLILTKFETGLDKLERAVSLLKGNQGLDVFYVHSLEAENKQECLSRQECLEFISRERLKGQFGSIITGYQTVPLSYKREEARPDAEGFIPLNPETGFDELRAALDEGEFERQVIEVSFFDPAEASRSGASRWTKTQALENLTKLENEGYILRRYKVVTIPQLPNI